MRSRLAFASVALLAIAPAMVAAQSTPAASPASAVPTAPARAPQIGDNPADLPEILDAVDLCRKATHGAATFEYRMLRDAGYKIGSRIWEPGDKKEDRGRLLMGFGKGNTAIFVRHGPVVVSCRVIVHVTSSTVSDKVRGELVSRKFAQTFDNSTDEKLKVAMSKIFPADSIGKILIGPEHYYDLFSTNRNGRELFSVTVYSSENLS